MYANSLVTRLAGIPRASRLDKITNHRFTCSSSFNHSAIKSGSTSDQGCCNRKCYESVSQPFSQSASQSVSPPVSQCVSQLFSQRVLLNYLNYFSDGSRKSSIDVLAKHYSANHSTHQFINKSVTPCSNKSINRSVVLQRSFPSNDINHSICTSVNLVDQSFTRRHLSTSALLSNDRPTQPEIKPPGTITSFVIKKYVDYLAKFDASFERKYPRVYKVYKLFKDGVKEFFVDTKIYYGVATELWSGKPLSSFSRKQLETYQQMPGDLLRSAPVLITVPLPFVPYAVFPLAYMFPRQLLCRHFWTEEQRREFALHDVCQRIEYYPRIIRYMEAHSESIRDLGKRHAFNALLAEVSKGQRADVDALVHLRDLFETFPFGLDHLQRRHKIHLWNLCHSFNVSRRPSKLKQQLLLQHHIDLATAREGLDSLSTTELQQACFARGLAAGDVEEKAMKEFLQDWLHVAQNTTDSSLSLLLHSPALLAIRFTPDKHGGQTTEKVEDSESSHL